MAPELLFLLFLILLNGFFSLCEMALVSARKARLRHEAEKGKANYRLALHTAEHPADFLSTIQVVITLIGTLAGAFGGATVAVGLESSLAQIPTLATIAKPLSIAVVVVLTTFVSVVLGELVPKNIALAHPESISASVIRPMRIVTTVFKPLVKILSLSTSFVIKLTGTRAVNEPSVTEEEVKVLIAQGTETGVFDDREREMMEGVLSLEDRRVTSLMTPRTEVVCIEISESLEVVRSLLVENARFAFMPVIDGDLDRILGMISTNEALASIARNDFTDLRPLMKRPVLVPESISALKAFSILRNADVRSALIVDEYGGISGLVAFTDLIETILGDVADNGTEEDPEIVRREDGSWLIDGSMGIDRFLKELDLDRDSLAVGDYDTLAGLILDRMGSIPKAGDRCEWETCTLEVVDMDGNRIDKVIVTIRDGTPDDGAEGGEPYGRADFD